MLSPPRCRAIYRLDLSVSQHRSYRLCLPLASIHFASYSTKNSSKTGHPLKSTSQPTRSKASVAASYISKPSTESKSTVTSTARENVLPNNLPNDRLNPPPSTRPPPLPLPTRDPSQPFYKYYYSLGRTYLTFYKTGLKNMYTNYKAARLLTSRLPPSETPASALEKKILTRAEWLTVVRSRADILRLPLFGLVFCICGEFTPLVVLVMSNVVPRSLWIPKQVEKARAKAEERRRGVFRNPDPALELETKVPERKMEEMGTSVLLHIGRSLGLYSTVWDRIGLPPTVMIRKRVKERMQLVATDDMAIERDGGVEAIEGKEVEMAAEMRGIDVLGMSEADLKRELKNWMQAKKVLEGKARPVTWLYLTRPAAWPLDERM